MNRYNLMLIVCVLLFTTCTTKNQNTNTSKKPNCKCNELSPTIEIWNNDGKNYIIGNWGDRKNNYSKSIGWNYTEYPYPKMFDMKLIITNNSILYDNPVKISKYKLSANLKLKVGQNNDATYPLNSSIVENISLIDNRSISDDDFKNGTQFKDYIELWQKNIDFNSLYSKYNKQGLFINQLIFEIHLTDSNNCNCNYEYIFPMAETEEP